ncbi:hypothetical protein [Phaeacidiphilus oryzae]|uniref:hypothetical protein n=1 Tax=Phaeacidiphilus oryzae TaxID=348818 RepID=UPI00055C11C1|nr:hypothetical protein [Phaeacidiphilus oryzae]
MSNDRVRRLVRLLSGLALTLGLGSGLALGGAAGADAAAASPSPSHAPAAGPASASVPASAPGSVSPGQRIADALRGDPVYVDPSFASAVPPARQRQLAQQIRATHLPIYAVLLPLVKGDSFNGSPDNLAEVVHDRMSRTPMVVITLGDLGNDELNGHSWPYGQYQAADAVSAVGFLPAYQNAGLADRVAKAVQLIKQGDGTKVYQQATASLDSGSSDSASSHSAGGRKGSTSSLVAGGIVVAVLLVLALLLTLRRIQTRARRGVATGRSRRDAKPFTFPRAVFAAARDADATELRRHAEAEVLALGEAIQQAAPARTPHLQLALDSYAAAEKVLDTAHGLPDLAGVLSLVTTGHDALDPGIEPDEALPLCFFNPLHGRAAELINWRPLGRRDHLDVATCPPCADALRSHRAPEVLTDEAADGTPTPYFELPPARSPWSATGYGSLIPATSPDGLPARINRGNR